jgi:ferric-dicitrate binding protein FerR (iron transport regulator)
MSDEKDQAALHADIERTRAALGDTVEALAHKADVSGRVKEKAAHAVESLPEPMRRSPVVAAAGLAAVLVALWLLMRGRN